MDDLRDELAELHEASFAWALSLAQGDRAEAEDVLQTSYWKILAGKARFGGRSSLKTWLFGIIRRTTSERRRRRSGRLRLLDRWTEELPPTTVRTEPIAELERQRDAARVAEALDCLSQRQRQIVELVFYHDLSISEAALAMGISRGSASVHYARAKQLLLAALEGGTP